jgi:LacI family transcriptional regulator
MLPTIKDVARHAGVSTATVSRVLNGVEVVSNDTRERVEQAIESLGYRYNALARSLKTQTTVLLGHIVPSIAGPVSPILARAVEDEARMFGYNVILCNSYDSAEKERANIDILLERRVDGIIFTSPMLPEHLSMIEDRGVPLIIVERRMEVSGYPFVEANNHDAARNAVKHLLDLGHRRIALILGLKNAMLTEQRRKGYEDALTDAGLSVDPDLIADGDYTRQSGYDAMQRLLKLDPRPTAVFGTNDAMTIGAMQAARHAGFECPREISFVGFDDTSAELAIPQLTTVHQPLGEIGTLAAKMLIAHIQGEPGKYPSENILPCHLEVRESCGPAPR